MSLHVIIGAGPVGWTTALLLADAGQDVRVVTRDGSAPEHLFVQRRRADAADPTAMRHAASDASVIYNAASPSYHRWTTEWPPLAASVLSAAEAVGAVLVTAGNLYGYGAPDHPMLETDPLNATTAKGRVRARVWRDAREAHQAGRVRATELRSSDYFGPRVLNSQLGERIVGRIVDGKSVRVVGDPDVPHSWTYIDDVARSLIVLGADERAWGQAWHTPTGPPRSQRQMITALSAAAQRQCPTIRVVSPLALRAIGAFVPDIGEITEVRYQLDEPFVVDSSAAQQTFGLAPTPMDDAVAETIAWYRHRSSTKEYADGGS